MHLDLREILHTPGASRSFQRELDLSELSFYGANVFEKPVVATGAVTNHAGALVLEGQVELQLSLQCDRCSEPFSRSRSVPLHSLLAQQLEDEGNDEIILLENGSLDLDEFITTTVVLAMDTKNLCSDACKGLCAKCGTNLNFGQCRCRPEVDPRLAALAQLLDNETE